MFSSKNFIVLGLTIRSLIHFEFIFMYGVRKCSNFIIVCVAVLFSLYHLFLLCNRLADYRCVGLSLGLLYCFIGLYFCFCANTILFWFFGYCSFLV